MAPLFDICGMESSTGTTGSYLRYPQRLPSRKTGSRLEAQLGGQILKDKTVLLLS